MAKEDYASAVVSGGGGLKLKGAKNAGIDKKRKKDKKKHMQQPQAGDGQAESSSNQVDEGERAGPQQMSKDSAEQERAEDLNLKEVGKTEAEKKHEEMRRKRVSTLRTSGWDAAISLTDFEQLDEKLRREGVKTHKERVEELNTYLSNLSEHHDM